MERIHHHYKRWEDYPAGFYDNCTGIAKESYVVKILEMFNSEYHTRESMKMVIETWLYSCEHNLSNDGMNKIAYISQAAACLFCGAPSTVTREVWSMISLEVQDRSNKIAEEMLNKWNNKNKKIQLCLNID